MSSELWCIVWRSGGTDNFRWHRSLPMTREEGEKALEAERAAGRLSSMLVNYRMSLSIGLPEGFAYNVAVHPMDEPEGPVDGNWARWTTRP